MLINEILIAVGADKKDGMMKNTKTNVRQLPSSVRQLKLLAVFNSLTFMIVPASSNWITLL